MKRHEDFCDDVLTCIGPDVGTVLDVGANVGQTAMRFAEVFSAASIHSFEPVAETYAKLVSNVAGLARVTCHNFGLGEAREKRRIYRQRDSGWHSIVKNIDRGLGEVDIALTTIDGFCSENAIASIDLLKSDTEGFDLAVLRGAREMLLQGRIKAIYSEVGFYPNDLGHTNFCELLAFLQASQFQLFNVYSVCSTYIEGLDFPWTNALFIRNDLIDAISRPAYMQWRRENG